MTKSFCLSLNAINSIKLAKLKKTISAQAEIDTQSSQLKTVINVISTQKDLPATELTTKQLVRNVYTALYYDAGLSFRRIPRALNTINAKLSLGLDWSPHFTSTINWCLYLGLGLVNSVKPIDEPWAAIIDNSIGIGPQKVFVVLRVPLNVLSKRGRAVRLEDGECIGLKVVEIVNGETTAVDLKAIFDLSGDPTLVIKDCDAALKKGVEIWSEEQEATVPVVEDIGHVAANALKAEFIKDEDFKIFISLLGKGSNSLRQTALAFLLPPKRRTKGRFQSMSRLARWAKKRLPTFSQKGRAKKGSLLDKLRKAFPGFSQLKSFVERFCLAC